jgi:hypothetical protein
MRMQQLMLCAVSLIAVPLWGQTPQKTASINKKVVGKWVSRDRKNYISFSADGSCAEGGLLSDGTWQVQKGQLSVWEQGEHFRCMNGALELIAPNILTRDYGMSGEVEKYYRGPALPSETVRPLTLAAAQSVLSRQIDSSTADNTLQTCHACYSPDDKGDNDIAAIVTTCSPNLSQFLIQRGYIRISGGTPVFTAKAKRSAHYALHGRFAGFRFANFRNPRILTSEIKDLKHVPIEYELVPTDVTIGFFGRAIKISSIASFSYENEAWRVCLSCGQ